MIEYRIKNWEKYQHYKNRTPPWIKLHRDILNDRAFMSLALASRGLLMQIWIVASENNGIISGSEQDLAWRLRIDKADLKPLITSGFIIDASKMQADASTMQADASTLQADASTEGEGEGEDKNKNPCQSSDGSDPAVVFPKSKRPSAAVDRSEKKALFSYWIETCGMGPPTPKFTEARKKLLDARLDEGYSMDDLAMAISGCSGNPHNQGQNDRKTKFMGWGLILRNAEKVDYFVASYHERERKKVFA